MWNWATNSATTLLRRSGAIANPEDGTPVDGSVDGDPIDFASKFGPRSFSYSPEQLSLLKETRNSLADVLKEGDTDADLLRFLRANQWNGALAESHFREQAAWREETKPELITEAEAEAALEYQWGAFSLLPTTDRYGRPVVVCTPARVKPALLDPQRCLRALLYIMEKALSMRHDSEDILVVVLFDGFAMRNVDYAFPKLVAHVTQTYYPERLSYGLLLNAPWIFTAVWRMLTPFLEERTVNKVVFMGTEWKGVMQFLVEDWQAALPVRLGGRWVDPQPLVEAWSELDVSDTPTTSSPVSPHKPSSP